jgi:hypothetical protein
MCIACELGYFAMIDALEAERAAKAETARAKEPGFVCDAPTEPSKPRRVKQLSMSPRRD